MAAARKRRHGVAIHTETLKPGMLRLVLDDVEAEDEVSEQWRQRHLFTFVDIDEAKARAFQLDRDIYAFIGDAVVARLLALDAAGPKDS